MIEITWATVPYILVHLFVAVVGVARLTRVVVYDPFPPTKWFRETLHDRSQGTRWASWSKLFTCWWCMAFWIALACIGWWIGGLYVLWVAWAWWIFWGALTIGYLAPMLIVRDGAE